MKWLIRYARAWVGSDFSCRVFTDQVVEWSGGVMDSFTCIRREWVDDVFG